MKHKQTAKASSIILASVAAFYLVAMPPLVCFQLVRQLKSGAIAYGAPIPLRPSEKVIETVAIPATSLGSLPPYSWYWRFCIEQIVAD